MRKRVLITGKNSYIGDCFSEFTTEYYDAVDTIDMIGDSWKTSDFSLYDAVVHVAALVHKLEKDYTKEEYFRVNCELAVQVAKKAKESGVSQFVFLSTMSVYGLRNGVITKDTKPSPFNNYGRSKLDAEKELQSLEDNNFTVTILRPPIVYGKGCKGNYVELSKFAKKMPFFPDYKSSRSMVYIENLCRFMKKSIDEKLGGVYCVQDKNYVNTSQMVKEIAKANGKNIVLTKIFNPFITLALKLKIRIVCKVFGSLTYEKDLCPDFEKVDFITAIKRTEE
ncbi:MAG: NAD-dependent epimerase/dehydratase family protein [Ruminococcus sp.]|nr:NAD-dependent epimerase/dehydratase family protein [Ruminococcus sp.]